MDSGDCFLFKTMDEFLGFNWEGVGLMPLSRYGGIRRLDSWVTSYLGSLGSSFNYLGLMKKF